MLRPHHAALRAVASLLLAALGGCGDSPTGPGNGDRAPLIISDVLPGNPSLRGGAPGFSAGSASVDPLAYVSLPPGAIPDGISATVTNLANGESFSRVMFDGGFDPVGIVAAAGDTLELRVVRQLGMFTARAVVPAARRPRIVRTSPAKGRTDVAVNASIVVVFSEPIDSTTLDAGSVRLLHQGSAVEGSLSVSPSLMSVELAPSLPLAPGTEYRIVVGDDVADRMGERLDGPTTFEFSTSGASPAPPPEAPTWEVQGTRSSDRYRTAGAVIDGILYIVGGRTDCCPWDPVPSAPVGTLESFNLSTGEWATLSPMPTPRHDFAVGVVDGILYAVGGHDGSDMVGTVEAYDPVTDTWTPRAPMPTPRLALGVGVVGGVLYAIGGLHYGAVIEAYDPVSDTWTRKRDMPTPRIAIGVGVVDGRLHAINGAHTSPEIGDGFTATVEAYDPAANTWSTSAATPSPYYRATAQLGGRLYSVGADVASYDPAANAWDVVAPLPADLSPEFLGAAGGSLYAVDSHVSSTGEATLRVHSLTP